MEYVEMPGVEGKKYFRCERHRATLSTEACAANWRSGNHLNNEDRIACRCCPIGAAHAGEGDASMSPLKGVKICSRCHRTAVRLIFGRVCVSCYNREREQTLGKNAKGVPPSKLPPLRPMTLRFICGGRPAMVTLDRAMDTLELIVAALRDSQNRVRFAFHASMPRGRYVQLRLF